MLTRCRRSSLVRYCALGGRRYKLKIIVSFLQVVTNMAFVLDLEWPAGFQSFISFFSFINLDFVPWQSVGCVAVIDYCACARAQRV